MADPEISRFPRKGRPYMPGSQTTPGPAGARINAPASFAFREVNNVGTRIPNAFAAQWLAYTLPYRRFAVVLAGNCARIGDDVGCYSFIAVDFHHIPLAGLPAHSLALRPAGSLNRPRRPLSRGFGPAGYPAKPLVSYQTKPTSVWADPPSAGDTRRRGAPNKSDVASLAALSPGGSMSQSLTERYDDRLAGMLSCYDRLVITGTLPVICYAAGMTGYLNAKGIRIFDYPEFAKTLRDRVRDRAATLAAEAGITIEHLAKPHIRKEDVVARVLRQRGDRPGLVHVISAMEACDAYKPWHDKQTHKTFIRPDSGKCLHYYFYFQDATFGLVYLRVPTWAPFRLQFYCNGHSWLARKLSASSCLPSFRTDNI